MEAYFIREALKRGCSIWKGKSNIAIRMSMKANFNRDWNMEWESIITGTEMSMKGVSSRIKNMIWMENCPSKTQELHTKEVFKMENIMGLENCLTGMAYSTKGISRKDWKMDMAGWKPTNTFTKVISKTIWSMVLARLHSSLDKYSRVNSNRG